ncbi:MAG: ABC transporter permease subunit [Alphaproteobacteria bacterium]|nr:ABC transporter permease subunit [Alphaproteobacteria bacterium]
MRRSVIVVDRIADWTISVGGIFVIVAVFGIMAFLAEVVVPLFTGGRVVAAPPAVSKPLAGRTLIDKVDEYNTLSVALSDSGQVTAFHIGTGAAIEAPAFDLGGQRVTAFAQTLDGANLVFGFADGSVRFGRLTVVSSVLPPGGRPADLRRLDGRDATDGKAIYSTITDGQIRRLSVATELEPPRKIADDGAAIVAIDYRLGGTVERPTRTFVTVDAERRTRLNRTETRVNMLTRQATETVRSATLPPLAAGFKVEAVLITDTGDQIYIADRAGTLLRFDTRNFDQPTLAETIDVVPGAVEITAIGFLIGEQSLVIGTSEGAVDIYFRLQTPGAPTTDGFRMIRAKSLERQPAAITAIAPSQRGKMFATADRDGGIWLRHATSEQTLLRLAPASDRGRYQALVLAPREDGVLAIGENGKVHAWQIAVPHPETTFASIFGKVWYEGYPAPAFTWQSSSSTDSFEPKLSLVPLIFGTIKAAFYSLLFAVPIALLGAIYTSEFLHHRVRAVIKPVMEMMASLPSVVLGFIAALILAPFVETWIAAVLLLFIVLPLTLLAAAHAWQTLPERAALALDGVPKFAFMFVVLGIGVWLTTLLAAPFERLVFAGDLRAWANGNIGTGTAFTTLLLLPLAYVAVAYGGATAAGTRLDALFRHADRLKAGGMAFGRWLVYLVLALVLAWIVASLLTAIGHDPRGGVVDTYVQRNTLVVGFAMGFAVIPLIYTIAEDSLNSVPEHLRAASLACGATPWQTAVWVILPTAASGVFAAIMIGMGRAVGETMIVVMAAGNTPVLEWNVFSGLRALSANIAVELPEAVRDSTLYRMLFLAALTLFVMTFVINTLAEVVRLRFRKRAAQL